MPVRRLFRVTGSIRFRIPDAHGTDGAAQAAVDAHKWRHAYENDAEIGSGFGMPAREDLDQSLDLFLHLNDVAAPTLVAAMRRGVEALIERANDLGRLSQDAYTLDVDAVVQAPREVVDDDDDDDDDARVPVRHDR